MAVTEARERGVEGNAVGFIFLGGFWALVGLGMLITGSGSISLLVYTELTKRQARIVGAATIVLGLAIVSISVLVGTGRVEGGEIALDVFFVFFVAVAVLATIMSAVQLVRWARDGEGAGELRKRAFTVSLVLVFQTAFLVFIGVMFTTL